MSSDIERRCSGRQLLQALMMEYLQNMILQKFIHLDLGKWRHFWGLPLPHLHVLPLCNGLCSPAVGWAQSPQLCCQISTNQNAACSHVAMDAVLTVYPSRSLCCSSSTTIMRGGCTETTPSSSGREGCGPSPDTKEAKPKKCCFSLLFAVSEEELTLPFRTLRMTFLLSMLALCRLDVSLGFNEKDAGRAVTWLKTP
ncbi:hypothetical protein FQN60_007870 [Etheostoma spectabile]|uniref:Uncharacterized protein n=1 Tax=Etheostoma spectabile TaxID=54343 RepID=A0A5J5D419_9PERO|nr:hypothetical protein FQN60_007870 [Etheostoma spectabile]